MIKTDATGNITLNMTFGGKDDDSMMFAQETRGFLPPFFLSRNPGV